MYYWYFTLKVETTTWNSNWIPLLAKWELKISRQFMNYSKNFIALRSTEKPNFQRLFCQKTIIQTFITLHLIPLDEKSVDCLHQNLPVKFIEISIFRLFCFMTMTILKKIETFIYTICISFMKYNDVVLKDFHWLIYYRTTSDLGFTLVTRLQIGDT